MMVGRTLGEASRLDDLMEKPSCMMPDHAALMRTKMVERWNQWAMPGGSQLKPCLRSLIEMARCCAGNTVIVSERMAYRGLGWLLFGVRGWQEIDCVNMLYKEVSKERLD